MFSRRTGWNLRPNRFSAVLAELRCSGRELLDLTESNPTQIGLSYPTDLLRWLTDPAGMLYQPEPRGLASAREAVVEYYRARGALVPVERVFLTTSTSEAYSFLFRLLCDPGDQVLVPTPSYPLFEFLAGIQDVELVPYPLFYDHGWHVDMHALQSKIGPRTRVVMVVHPNNPTGSFVKSSERDALNESCRRHELALVADEVFLDYAVESARPFTFASNDSALTFTLSGLSKIAALPQMKLSWIAASGPESVMDQALSRLEVIADTYLSANTPVQLALSKLLQSGPDVQAQIAERVRANLSELDRQLQSHRECCRLEIEAGWYVVLRVPVTRSDEELAITLLQQHGVVVHPGQFYDFPQEGYLVISLIVPPEQFRDGIGRVLAAAHATP